MYAIDTAETIRKLTAVDMPEAQARVIVDTFKHPDAELATKTDLRTSIKELRQELKADNQALRQEFKMDIGRLEADIGKLSAEFGTEMKWIKWAIGANVSLTLLIMLKLVFF